MARFLPHFKQTLHELGLSSNQIGHQGAQYIAEALETNQVFILLLFLSHTLYLIPHRHLPHSTSKVIKLEIKELNTLLMLSKRIE
jgi:hypothetical protein